MELLIFIVAFFLGVVLGCRQEQVKIRLVADEDTITEEVLNGYRREMDYLEEMTDGVPGECLTERVSLLVWMYDMKREEEGRLG